MDLKLKKSKTWMIKCLICVDVRKVLLGTSTEEEFSMEVLWDTSHQIQMSGLMGLLTTGDGLDASSLTEIQLIRILIQTLLIDRATVKIMMDGSYVEMTDAWGEVINEVEVKFKLLFGWVAFRGSFKHNFIVKSKTNLLPSQFKFNI